MMYKAVRLSAGHPLIQSARSPSIKKHEILPPGDSLIIPRRSSSSEHSRGMPGLLSNTSSRNRARKDGMGGDSIGKELWDKAETFKKVYGLNINRSAKSLSFIQEETPVVEMVISGDQEGNLKEEVKSSANKKMNSKNMRASESVPVAEEESPIISYIPEKIPVMETVIAGDQKGRLKEEVKSSANKSINSENMRASEPVSEAEEEPPVISYWVEPKGRYNEFMKQLNLDESSKNWKNYKKEKILNYKNEAINVAEPEGVAKLLEIFYENCESKESIQMIFEKFSQMKFFNEGLNNGDVLKLIKACNDGPAYNFDENKGFVDKLKLYFNKIDFYFMDKKAEFRRKIISFQGFNFLNSIFK